MGGSSRDPGSARPPVSILCPDLSSNALGRSLLLAELLRWDVEILGVMTGPDLWPPAVGTDVAPIRRGPVVASTRDLRSAVRWLENAVRGEVLIVSKPMPTSLGLVLDADLSGRRLVLDIDDWEYGLCLAPSRNRVVHALALAAGPWLPHRPNHAARIRKLEGRVPEIRDRLVSNTWLQDRFGGTVLYHVRDPDALDPDRVDAEPLRRVLDLEGRAWVGFVGTYRPHKGLDVLVEALLRVDLASPPGLLLMGLGLSDAAVATLLEDARARLGADRVRATGPFPLAELPAHVCAADLIAIPSRSCPASQGQVPAKLFDAMALARPIVASAVNDVSGILKGCGRTVPPDDARALAAVIAELAGDPDLRRDLGTRARQRLIENYSFAAGRQVLADMLTPRTG
jgi:glycosyltransferase involved in cell wall biosynthesis